MINTQTEVGILNRLATIARDNNALAWFDHGDQEFLFDDQRRVEYPALMVQTTGWNFDRTNTTYNFTLYVMDNPVSDTQVDNSDYEWDSNTATSRDTTAAIMRDVVGAFALSTAQQDYRVELLGNTTGFARGRAQGWRLDLQVITQHELSRT